MPPHDIESVELTVVLNMAEVEALTGCNRAACATDEERALCGNYAVFLCLPSLESLYS